MHFAICYVSTVAPNLADSDIKDILTNSRNSNNHDRITGILLFSEGNFFQVLEGKKNTVTALFERIKMDPRHYDLIPIFRKEIAEREFEDYEVDFLSMDSRYNNSDLDFYLEQVKKLNPTIQSSVSYIIRNFS